MVRGERHQPRQKPAGFQHSASAGGLHMGLGEVLYTCLASIKLVETIHTMLWHLHHHPRDSFKFVIIGRKQNTLLTTTKLAPYLLILYTLNNTVFWDQFPVCLYWYFDDQPYSVRQILESYRISCMFHILLKGCSLPLGICHFQNRSPY